MDLRGDIFVTKEAIEQAILDEAPATAAGELVRILKRLFSVIGEEEKTDLVMNLFGEAGSDKIGSMVHR